MVVGSLPIPPPYLPHHPQKRAHNVVFDGGLHVVSHVGLAMPYLSPNRQGLGRHGFSLPPTRPPPVVGMVQPMHSMVNSSIDCSDFGCLFVQDFDNHTVYG
jgi:hypothetical protein